MALVLPIKELKRTTGYKVPVGDNRPSGLLNSNYKKLVKRTLNTTKTHSLFNIKQGLKTRQYQFTSSIETVLKVSAFAAVFMIIFS